MTADPTEPFLAAIRDARLLDPARLHDLTAWVQSVRPDPNTLAQELNRRGWLTPFQIREIYKGRGLDLVIGPYILLDLVGEGGMGRVYKAHHTRLGRVVALKLIRKEKLSRPNVLPRFRQEIQAIAHLSHPNVVLALDADEFQGTPYYAMEYVEGENLTHLVEKLGPMPFPLACEYIRQAAMGLQHAFERGLVHRDVKPSNLLVTPKGQIKVLDLGLAMLKEVPGGQEGARVTQDGLVIGTPDFLAPEQAQNPTGVDIRADVYGLGATLYYLLSGKVPFDGETPTDKLLKHITEPPPSILAVRPDVPPPLDALIRAMMAKHPEERPPTPAHVTYALAPFCPAPPPTPMSGPHPPPMMQPGAIAPSAYPPPGYPPPGFVAAMPEAAAAIAPQPMIAVADGPRETYRAPSGGRWVLPTILFLFVLSGAVAAAGGLFLIFRDQILPVDDSDLAAEFTNPVGMRMLLIPPGSFTMGSADGEEGRDGDEGPPATVTMSYPFYMSETEVTRAQFVRVTGTSHSRNKSRDTTETPEDSATWSEAVEFCDRLTQRDDGRRRGWVYRLPTEAEWEYACRAGSETPFSFGERAVQITEVVCKLNVDDPYLDPDESIAERQRNRVLVPYPAGARKPNKFGLQDMSGNMWEWCRDYYAPYPEGPRTDPTGPDTGDWRVLRGGAWDEDSTECRCASRRGADSQSREKNIGFRVVYARAR